ncbi:ATP-binding protein [Paraburkholderia nodosa]|uniref:ATP-binding protein n=1 Tax=Paraburkholderia nodosa TaxID=392320 RepID=UPI00047F3ACC|nr:ATP-binding protein [Paraburkholderia nodosa]
MRATLLQGESGSAIILAAHHSVLDGMDGDAHAALWASVTDTGPGIAAKVVHHLFDSLATT